MPQKVVFLESGTKSYSQISLPSPRTFKMIFMERAASKGLKCSAPGESQLLDKLFLHGSWGRAPHSSPRVHSSFLGPRSVETTLDKPLLSPASRVALSRHSCNNPPTNPRHHLSEYILFDQGAGSLCVHWNVLFPKSLFYRATKALNFTPTLLFKDRLKPHRMVEPAPL